MPDPANLLPTPAASPGCFEGTFLTTPDSLADPVQIRLDGNDIEYESCPWMPKDDEWPGEGDMAWVSFSDAGTPVVVAWWRRSDEEVLYG